MKVKVPDILLKQAERLEKYYAEKDPALGEMVRGCFLNTIETTVEKLPDGGYFVITGDIDAMWLRDSASQVGLYARFAKEDQDLQEILEGVIARQMSQVNIDPYANAFNRDGDDINRGWQDDTERCAWIWERKYEVDSLCAPLYLSWSFWKATGICRIFDESWLNGLKNILKVFRTEQDHTKSAYYFRRSDCRPSDTIPCDGIGNPVGFTGMTWSGFRPSDDSCIYNYLIPSNMMAVCALKRAAEIVKVCYHQEELAAEAEKLAAEIDEGIRKYGIVDHPVFGKIYAYETDGLGHYNLMDDANSPGLLAIPYLGYADKDDTVYRNTRRFVLSKENPYYSEGKYAKGIGSPHTDEGYIWHIGLTMCALTSDDPEEILSMLTMLKNTHAGTKLMHESFHPDDPSKYTRSWFAWANTLFAQLLQELMEEDFFEK